MTLRLHYALRSDVGHVRELNEDSAYAGSRLLAVADGMGGHAAGEVASSTVISMLADLDEDVAAGDLLDSLADAIRYANAHLREMTDRDNSLDGMGTTATALLSSGSRLGVLHVGDSRMYLLRDGELTQITHDHTLVQDLVDAGRITAEQATTHPQRSLLMRALDGRDVEPDLSVREARLGDRYLLCSDGLSAVVSDDTIGQSLRLRTPQEAVDRLVDLALKGGGPDNITVVVADVVEDDARHDDYPLVAGAAAERGTVPHATAVPSGSSAAEASGDSAAARAAGAVRKATDDTTPDLQAISEHPPQPAGPPPRRRRRRRTALIFGGVFVVLVIAAGAAVWAYVRSQYYVGVDSGRVAIFQGVEGSFVGVKLNSVHGRFMAVSDLPPYARSQVGEGIQANNKGDAHAIIDRLTTEAQAAKTPPPVTPTASPTPKVCTTTAPPAAAGGRPRVVPTRCPSVAKKPAAKKPSVRPSPVIG